ncbi:MAG: O-antigen ligase family protein [Hyphomonadaceae bacterium]|nr:O-antigen ligase family protein [Hyphomonadaceae bacterium]
MATMYKRVFADVLDIAAFLNACRDHAMSAVFVFIMIVHTSVAVTLPAKFIGPSSILGGVWAAAVLMCLAYVAIKPIATLKAALAAWPFIGLGLWIVASISWTVTPYETIRGGILYSASLLYALAIAATFSWDRIIKLLAWTLLVLLCLSVALALIAPQIGQMQGELAGAWSGVWAEKQALGFHASLALLAALAMLWRGEQMWVWVGAIGLSLMIIIASRSTTAIVMTGIGVGLLTWFGLFYRGFAAKLIGTWVAYAGAILAVPLSAYAYEALLTVSGKTSDLSGRREIWDGVRALGDMRPELGWGYQGIWRGEQDMISPMQWIIDRAQFAPANAHSSWLDAYVQLGSPVWCCWWFVWFGLGQHFWFVAMKIFVYCPFARAALVPSHSLAFQRPIWQCRWNSNGF